MGNEAELTDAQRTDAAQDLVIHGSPSKEVTAAVSLDRHVGLLAAIHECRTNAAFWSKRGDQLKEELELILGGATKGLVNGVEAVTYSPIAKFSVRAFEDKYPNLARAYMHTVTREEVDVELIRTTRPELYAEFQTRPVVLKWKPPGATSPRADG